MDDRLAYRNPAPVLTEIPRMHPAPEPAPRPARRRRGFPVVNLALFLITLLSTTMAGAELVGAPFSIWSPLATWPALAPGLWFSVPLMAILLAHEMGHYITARIHGVDSSLPYFIPAPGFEPFGFIGTFGAFIRMREMPRSRRVMFDIGAAGPWAGMLLAVPAVIIGLQRSTLGPLDPSGFQLGNSILFLGLTKAILHVNPRLVNIDLSPIAFAGWLGFLVTTLNLFPVGQLDGGHVLYALAGRWHRAVSILFVALCFAGVGAQYYFGFRFWLGWVVWGGLILILVGVRHPATLDAHTPLNPARKVCAWASVALFVVTFMPVPVWFAPQTLPPSRQNQRYSVIYHGSARPERHALARLSVRL